MGRYSRKSFWIALLLLFVAADGARGQWRIVAPNAVAPSASFGAMKYKDGILWAGTTTLVFSSDSGRTWHPTSYPGSEIYDITFANRRFGVIASLGYSYLTRDGGQTWSTVTGLKISTSSVVCTDDQKGIYAFKWNDDNVYISLDSGNNWQSTTVGSGEMTLTRASDGILYIVSNYGNPGVVYSSTDSGATWKQQAGMVGEDCWSIAADNCDPARLYITTENLYTYPWLSRLFASSDRGATWTVGYSDPREVAGSVVSFGGALFAGTIRQGIMRSTDYGMSWQNSGGPNGALDNRGICMINEDIAFALDPHGNIWGTINGGDDSIPVTRAGSLTPSSPTLFEGDTLSCDSLRRSVFFIRSGCAPPSISQWSIMGKDAASFEASNFSFDSILVTLHGAKQGTQNAQLLLTLDNGTSETVELAGVVKRPPNTLSVSPTTVFESDTISCNGLSHSILFSRTGCSPPSVLGWSVTGPDSASFKASNLSTDSISVKLYGVKPGNQHAQLVLLLDNGSNDTVALAGYVNLTPNTLIASPATVFQSDTISCDSLTHSILFSRSGCTPPSVSGWSVIGVDSSSFLASNLSYGSISVTLYGLIQGDQQAQLVLSLDNGTSDTVALAGFVNILPTTLSMLTTDVKTDTLGATVSVQITINGLKHPEDVDLILHYDGTMDYLGSFSPSGVKLDILGEQWPGRSKLRIAGAAPGMVAGYAKFNVFNDSSEAAHATFDSMNVLTAISPCEYSLPEAVTSTITTLSGCNITMLSPLIHLGEGPRLSVRPNPATGDVWISSSGDLVDVNFAVYDMLGTQRCVIVASVQKNNPVKLTLPEADGVYTIVLKPSAYDRLSWANSLRVVRHH